MARTKHDVGRPAASRVTAAGRAERAAGGRPTAPICPPASLLGGGIAPRPGGRAVDAAALLSVGEPMAPCARRRPRRKARTSRRPARPASRRRRQGAAPARRARGRRQARPVSRSRSSGAARSSSRGRRPGGCATRLRVAAAAAALRMGRGAALPPAPWGRRRGCQERWAAAAAHAAHAGPSPTAGDAPRAHIHPTHCAALAPPPPTQHALCPRTCSPQGHTGSGRAPSRCARSESTRSPPTCSYASCPSPGWCAAAAAPYRPAGSRCGGEAPPLLQRQLGAGSQSRAVALLQMRAAAAGRAADAPACGRACR
jgi:hypothetical protein